jgi:signal transduction histidine kinase
MTVSDDGRGFDLAEGMSKTDHWGLKNMQERAEQIHSTCNITSAPGAGTVITVRVRISRMMRFSNVTQ